MFTLFHAKQLVDCKPTYLVYSGSYTVQAPTFTIFTNAFMCDVWMHSVDKLKKLVTALSNYIIPVVSSVYDCKWMWSRRCTIKEQIIICTWGMALSWYRRVWLSEITHCDLQQKISCTIFTRHCVNYWELLVLRTSQGMWLEAQSLVRLFWDCLLFIWHITYKACNP